MATATSFEKKIRLGYLLSFLLLLCSNCLLFYVQQKQEDKAGWLLHSYSVVNKSETLKAELTGAETGIRGYIITQDTLFLKPYNEALKQIPVIYIELKTLLADNREQLLKFDTLGQLVKRRLDILKSGLGDFRKNGFVISEEWKQRRQEAQTSMDSVRLYVTRLNDEEQKLMLERKTKLSGLFKGVKIMAIVSLVIGLISLLFSLITFNMEKRKKDSAEKQADRIREDLESNKNVIREKDMELKEFKEMEKFTTTGRIARTIAHEVRNPLTNILLATEQLKETEGRNEEAKMLLDLINRNASRISQLVADLLNATRFTHLDFGMIEVNQLLDETMEMANDRIDLNKISLQKKYCQESCCVNVDKEKIKVALLNIIVNAIEAMENKTDKVLELKTKKAGDKCIIEINDNGKGMNEEEVQKLFDPYYTTKPKGNGLGLTNTQSIILNHNGTIAVSSRPGEGSVFSISLGSDQK